MTDVLLYALGILIMVVGFAVSIGLHEIGHLVPAKLFGVRVSQYMIGFGKTLWSRRKGETEYGIKALPLGGYVAMSGMYPPAKPGATARPSTTGFLNTVMQEGSPSVRADSNAEASNDDRADSDADSVVESVGSRRGIAGMVDEARAASAESISDGEDHRTFYQLPVWKKIIVMLGGPVMNLVLAAVFFGIVLIGFGLPQYTTTVSAVSQCLIPASTSAETCEPDSPEAPAATAGILPGDRIVAINGEAITEWQQIRDTISAAPGAPTAVTVERDGTEQTLQVTPAVNQRYASDEAGNVVTGSDGEPVIETVGMIGVSPASEMVRQPVTEVVPFVADNVARVTNVILHLPQRLVDVWNAAFGAEERDADGPISVVGVGRIAGEIASLDTVPIAARAQNLIGLLGSLNVALFVFNLIPLMPLDGGHIAGALYEGLKRGWARLRGKPDPGPIDTAKMVPVTFVVVVVLGAMSVLLIYADIVKPVSLFG